MRKHKKMIKKKIILLMLKDDIKFKGVKMCVDFD